MSTSIINTAINYIKNVLQISFDKDIIIDPCAGKGDLMNGIDFLARFTFHYQTYSIKSESLLEQRIMPLDFLSIDYQQFDKTALAGLWYDKVHIISCPPENDIAQFLKKCSEFADTISFIMPKTYLSPIVSNFHLSLLAELDDTSMLKIWSKNMH
jgi:hypothetical protein